MARVARKKEAPGASAILDPVETGSEQPKVVEVSTTCEEFFALWAAHKARADLSCYIYRLWPVIDRGRVGIEKRYIDVVPGSNLDFSESWVKRSHGSGKYRLMAVDAGNARHRWVRVLDINDPDYPPGEDPRELVLGDPKNLGEEQRLRRLGKLEGDDVQEPGTTAALSGALTALVAKVGESKPPQDFAALTSAVDLIEKMNGPRVDPFAIVAQIQALQGGGQSAFQEKLLTLLIEQRNPAPVAAAVNVPGVGNIDDFLKLKKVFDSFRGGGEDSDSGGFGAVMQQWAPMLIAVVTRFLDRPSGPPAGYSVPAGYVLTPRPTGGDGGALAAYSGAPAAPAAFNPGEINERVGGVNLIDAYSMAMKALDAFQRGVSGDQFADSLVSDPLGVLQGKGEGIYNQLCEFGRSQILMVLKTSPAWALLSAREADVNTFVDDFLLYGAAPLAASADASAEETKVVDL